MARAIKLGLPAIGVLLATCLMAQAAEADKAAEDAAKAAAVFQSLYGEDLKRVAATRDTADDVALAARLLEAAKAAETQPALLALLCEKAADLGLADPRGFDTALAAADLLAAKGVEAAPELACVELGDWYRDLATAAAGALAKSPMLVRARAYYDRFLSLHTSADIDRSKVELALRKVEDDLKALGVPTDRAAWIDLLKLVDTSKDTAAGQWTRTDAGVTIVPSLNSRLMLPAALAGDYELELKFVRTGGDAVCATFPAGSAAATLLHGGAHEAVRHSRLGPGGMATGCPPQGAPMRDHASSSRRRYGT